MAKTAKVYPTTTAHQYWRGTGWTANSPYTRAYAGETSYTYLWPLPFDLSAYKNKILKSLTLYVKMDSGSNNFSTSEYIGAGLSTSNDSASDAANRTKLNSNEHQMIVSGHTWQNWNIADAWNTLKNGLAYIVMYGNEYAIFFTNYGTVAEADRPYILIEYDEGTVGVMQSDGLHRCQMHYMHTDGLHLVQPFYMAADGLHEISV